MKTKVINMFGKLKPLMTDPDITEIMVNGTKTVLVEKDGVVEKIEVQFESDKEISDMMCKLFSHFNRRLDDIFPYGDICLEDGTRINVVLPTLVQQGTSVTIRKISKKITTLDDLVEKETMTEQVKNFLIACIKLKLNMLFSGGTGVGKTTLLKLLSDYISDNERIICIEDAPELYLTHPNVLNLQTRQPNEDGQNEVSLRDLIRNSLRMRPDRVIVGEIRGEEAVDILQTMSTGHRGTLTIMHGNSPQEVIARLATLIKFSGLDIPTNEVTQLIASTLEIIVHVEQMADGTRKVTYVSEVAGVEKKEVMLEHIFKFRDEGFTNDGKILGRLLPSFRNYPRCYETMIKQKLIDRDALE